MGGTIYLQNKLRWNIQYLQGLLICLSNVSRLLRTTTGKIQKKNRKRPWQKSKTLCSSYKKARIVECILKTKQGSPVDGRPPPASDNTTNMDSRLVGKNRHFCLVCQNPHYLGTNDLILEPFRYKPVLHTLFDDCSHKSLI